MDDLLDRLRARNWRLTAERRAVAEVLSGSHVHLTADDVHARAVARLPELSRATVYNTLNELTALGEVREVSVDGRVRRYDPNTTVPHQHLVCDGCGAIFDVALAGPPVPSLGRRDRHGFVIDRVDVVYRGRCPDCSR